MMDASGRGGWWWPLGLISGLAVAVLSTLGSASAAPLGGVTAPGLAGFSVAADSGAPSVIAHENFTGTNGANLSGTSTDSGGFTWTANNGTWTVQSNRARSTSANTANLVFDTGVNNGAVEVTIYRNGNNNWDTMVLVNANSTASDSLIANWWSTNNGTLDLYKRVSGSFTLLASVTNLYPSSAPASATIRLETSSSTVNVYLDGVLRITYTLTGSEQTLFKNSAHHYAGLAAFFDSVSTFDNFHLDA